MANLLKRKEIRSREIFVDENQYFVSIDMNINRHPFEWLMAGLKTTYDNLGILHRNTVGWNFFSDHEQLEKYYTKIGEIADDVIEILIGLGGKEISIYEAVQVCPSLIVDDFVADETFSLVSKMFEMLITGFMNCKNYVPDDVYSKFEEYMYWLQKEKIYKLKNYFKEIKEKE